MVTTVDLQFLSDQYTELKLPILDVLALRWFYPADFGVVDVSWKMCHPCCFEIDVCCVPHFCICFSDEWPTMVQDCPTSSHRFSQWWWVIPVLGDVQCVRLWVTDRVRLCESLWDETSVWVVPKTTKNVNEDLKKRQNTVTLQAVSDFRVYLPELTFVSCYSETFSCVLLYIYVTEKDYETKKY